MLRSPFGPSPGYIRIIPSLASHWSISKDKMTYKFRINPDARWWDGMPVTSDDVIATWELMMDETILSHLLSLCMRNTKDQ